MSFLQTGTIYSIKARHSGKVLGIGGASQDNGAQVIQWDWANVNNEKWRVIDLGDDIYTFQAIHSGQFMSVYRNETNNGSWIVQYPANDQATSQQFLLTDASDGYFYMRPMDNTNKYVAVAGGSKDNGTSIIIWDPSTEKDEQRFKFEVQSVS